MATILPALYSEEQVPLNLPDILRWSVDEFYALGAAGFLDPDLREELIDGLIYTMPPQNELHYAYIQHLVTILSQALGSNAIVRPQGPLRINDRTTVEPNILVVRSSFRDSAGRSPSSEHALFLIEVAGSSLVKDRGPKQTAYAESVSLNTGSATL